MRLLISILLPALSKARQQATSLACQANLHSIGEGIAIYGGDNRGTLPYGWWDGTWPTVGAFNPAFENDWVTLTIATLNGKYVATANNVATNGSITTKIRATFLCPDAPGQGVISPASSNSSVAHYGCHPRLMPILNGQNMSPYFLPYKMGHIKRSSDICLIFDASLLHLAGDPADTWTQNNTIPVLSNIDGGIHNGGFNGPTKLSDNYTGVSYTASSPIDMTTNAVFNPSASINSDSTSNVSNVRFRHIKNTVCNSLMVDGHVQSFHLNPLTHSPDMLHRNINVNP